jgi:hypothetical protein
MTKGRIITDGHVVRLENDMRTWSDAAHGSGAIKAHADVVVCQERETVDHSEVVFFGAFMKDGPDVEPTALEETDAESFFWVPRPQVPAFLLNSYLALKDARKEFANQAEAARVIADRTGLKRSACFNHVKALMERGFLLPEGKGLVLKVSPEVVQPEADDLLATKPLPMSARKGA